MNSKVIAHLFNGRIVDLHHYMKGYPIYSNGAGIIFRHSLAHLLAKVLLDKFGRQICFGVGPATDEGFFYDVSCESLQEQDLPAIYEAMMKYIRQDLKYIRKTISREQAIALFSHDPLKMSILDGIETGEQLSIYTLDNFTDLCKGPHVISTGQLQNVPFTITMRILPNGHKRIVGICQDGITARKELDHRDLIQQMELASFFEVSPGFVTWHPRGVGAVEKIKAYLRKMVYAVEYQEICTPAIMKKEIWKLTGHLDKYAENMFLFEDEAMKPMSCPAHALYFGSRHLSYKHLPFRIGEFGSCFRNENQGGLMGLKRLRNLTQDDGHIFCRLEHVQEEIAKLINKAKTLYEKFGFKNILIKLATRPDKFIGTDEIWNSAEQAILQALNTCNIEYLIEEGDGAFYGPKIDIYLGNNKYWQCGTIQLDFNLPQRLNIAFINEHGLREHPVVIHRALLGSLERFMAMLLEEHGKLPASLDNLQFVILPISEKIIDYAQKTAQFLRDNGFTGLVDTQNDTLNRKIVYWSERKVHNLCILGNREEESDTISVRQDNRTVNYTKEELVNYFQKYYE